MIDLPTTVNRSNVIVPQSVWTEVDLGIAAVRDCHGLLNAHGLGARRGVLLCGPPGTGKSAVSAVAAGTSVIEDTIYVDRFTHVPELARLGADIELKGNVAVVKGVERLSGAPVRAFDGCRPRRTQSSQMVIARSARWLPASR